MNPAVKSILPAVLDPVVAAAMEQLRDKVEAKDRVIAEKNQALAAADAIIRQLKEALRLERIRKYGKQSETLSDLQLELLDREPAVSSEEIETEAAGGPLDRLRGDRGSRHQARGALRARHQARETRLRALRRGGRDHSRGA